MFSQFTIPTEEGQSQLKMYKINGNVQHLLGISLRIHSLQINMTEIME